MRTVLILGCVALAGCSAESLVQSAYPDRAIFEFPTSDGLSFLTYACAPGENEQATTARATQTHVFVETNLNAAAEVFADQIIDGVETDAGALSTSILAARTINQNADLVVEQAEDRFQCLLFDQRDA